MKTLIIRMNEEKPDIASLEKCACIIARGGIVAFPTETVYGLGANALDEDACKKIYLAKGRPPEKALSCLVGDIKSAFDIAYADERALKLFERFSPGPLTLVLPKKSVIPDFVTAGMNTVGVRIPANNISNMLIKMCGVPVAAPSANISGFHAPVDGAEVIRQLDGRVDAIIDAGSVSVGVESTIVSLTGVKGKILRAGAVLREEIEKLIELE